MQESRAVVLLARKEFYTNIQLIQLQHQKKQTTKNTKKTTKITTKLIQVQVQDTISFSLGAWGSGVSGTAVDAT